MICHQNWSIMTKKAKKKISFDPKSSIGDYEISLSRLMKWTLYVLKQKQKLWKNIKRSFHESQKWYLAGANWWIGIKTDHIGQRKRRKRSVLMQNHQLSHAKYQFSDSCHERLVFRSKTKIAEKYNFKYLFLWVNEYMNIRFVIGVKLWICVMSLCLLRLVHSLTALARGELPLFLLD